MYFILIKVRLLLWGYFFASLWSHLRYEEISVYHVIKCDLVRVVLVFVKRAGLIRFSLVLHFI